MVLHHYLEFAGIMGHIFRIPYVVSGQHLLALPIDPRPVIVCSAHMPLIQAAVHTLVEMSDRLISVITDHPNNDCRFAVWGLGKTLPAIRSDTMALVRARTALRKGGLVLGLVDQSLRSYSPGLFELARRTGARLLFVSTALNAGKVEVRFSEPPEPLDGNEAICANAFALFEIAQGGPSNDAQNFRIAKVKQGINF